MIRRDEDDPSGDRSWLLISQVEHARLAHQLAKDWGDQPCGPLEHRAALLDAIFHHDDGWYGWESMPEIDRKLGRPLAFSEMPLGESLAIWKKSIAGALDFGPLASYLVNRHFASLLRQFDRWRDNAAETALAEAFLADVDERAAAWRSAARAAANGEAEVAGHDRAASWLRWFDALSLWFCVARRHVREVMQTPLGMDITLTPIAGQEVRVSPWPWRMKALEVTANARRVPARRYESASELAAAVTSSMVLTWSLSPE